MAVRTAVRIKIYVTVLAVTSVAAWMWPVVNQPRTGTDDDKVLLTLIVTRTVGGPAVDITYTVGRGDGTPDLMTGRRWTKVISVKRTDRVTLRAYQGALPHSWRPARDKLTCQIKRGGVLIDDNERADVGSIRCYFPVR